MLRERPPSYASHDPQTINLPSVPTADPPPIHHERVLPPLPPMPIESKYRQELAAEAPLTWPSSNPLTAYYQPGPSQLSPKPSTRRSTDSPNGMDLDLPDNRARRGGSVLSIDDPDVRLAAEALGDLRAGMFCEEFSKNLLLTSSQISYNPPLIIIINPHRTRLESNKGDPHSRSPSSHSLPHPTPSLVTRSVALYRHTRLLKIIVLALNLVQNMSKGGLPQSLIQSIPSIALLELKGGYVGF